MNTKEMKKLNNIIYNIQASQDNAKIVKEHYVVIDNNELYRPAIYITASDYLLLCKIVGVRDTLFDSPISELPHITINDRREL